mgnify:CR=1 FL=1
MSLPTYIRRRRVADPAEYLHRAFGERQQLTDRAFWHRVLQLHKGWEEDYEGFYINPVKRITRPFWLLADRAADQALVVGASAASAKIPFTIDTSGHYEVAYLMFQATSSNFLVEVFDAGNNEAGFQNREIHAVTVAGTARRPFVLPESWVFNVEDAPRLLLVRFTDRSGSSNTIRWAFHGRRWFHKDSDGKVQEAVFRRFQRRERLFSYFLGLTGIPTGSTEDDNLPAIRLTADQAVLENRAPYFISTDEADTELVKLNFRSDGAFEFQLRETQSNGRILSNGFIRNTMGMGDGEFPFVFPEGYLLERNHRLLLELRDLSSAQNDIYATAIGRRLQYA